MRNIWEIDSMKWNKK